MNAALELANKLTGVEYPPKFSAEVIAAAKDAGLVIVYGASDDLMEFEGSIYDELGAYGGQTAYLTSKGLLQNDCENDDCPHFAKMKDGAATIDAIFGKDGYTWMIETEIPHVSFEIVEDGEKFCRGIVFALSDVNASPETSPAATSA